MKDYKTVSGEGFAEIIEKKSRFIAQVAPVSCEGEAIDMINRVRAAYPDATHHVYAYICRENNSTRYSDDREPSGTAGLPVLDVMRHDGLTDICAVVTRYFGGTLLGTGGLVRAYSSAAKAGILNAGVTMMIYSEIFTITAEYPLLGKLQYIISENNFNLLNTEFGENVVFTVSVEKALSPKLINEITEASLGKAIITKTGEGFTPTQV